MTARSANFDLKEIASSFGQQVGDYGSGIALAAGVFYIGAGVVYDPSDDRLKPAITGTGLISLGRCESSGTGTANGLAVKVKSGIFGPFDNSASADEIANNDAGKVCYWVDDATVALTSGSATRSVAGTVYKVDGNSKVYVAIDPTKVP
jgi:hypothetical protein